MRNRVIAGVGLAFAATGSLAVAQQPPGTTYRAPGARPAPAAVARPVAPPAGTRAVAAPRVVQSVTSTAATPRRARWGSKVGGRWWAGANAPGGWNSYRRPTRGSALPPYWIAPRFAVNDWSSYALPQPPQGYAWTRYYDDAVLIDSRGSVYDTMGGLDWDRVDRPVRPGVDYAQVDRTTSATARPAYPAPRIAAPRGLQGDDRVTMSPPPRRDTGAGGAVAGAAVGGLAGNVIAGRGNRLGGTLIGAGVGAAAGYAIDKAEDRGRPAPPPLPPRRGGPDHRDRDAGRVYAGAMDGGRGFDGPRYDDPRYEDPGYDGLRASDRYFDGRGYDDLGYDGPGYDDPGYEDRPVYVDGRAGLAGGRWVSPDGMTTVTTTGGAYPSVRSYPGGSSTTVVIQSAPVTTTTTTTEYITEPVRYTTHGPRTTRTKTRYVKSRATR